MAPPEMPTLQDVSRLAGVSTATVSRALNEPDKVAEKTRAKIEVAVDQLGYTPNFGGRVLASNRTDTVGAIIPSMANAMFASGLQAFQEELSVSGVTMLVASSGYDAETERQQIRKLISHGAGGLMLIGHERLQETRDFLAMRAVPHVMSWCYHDDPDGLYIGFDNFQAAHSAVSEVLAAGHRRIAMIAGICKGNDRAEARVRGVRAAIKAHGGAELVHLIEAEYLLDSGRSACARLLSEDRPTAIICGNDVLAAGAIVEAQAQGIAVPDDISVIGFDDIGLATVISPNLSTVRVPQLDMGRLAARVLLQRIRGEAAESIKLPTEFIHRGSLGQPSSR